MTQEEEKIRRVRKLFNFNFMDHIRRSPQTLVPIYTVTIFSLVIGGITMYNNLNSPDVQLKHPNDGTNPDEKLLHSGVFKPESIDIKGEFEKPANV